MRSCFVKFGSGPRPLFRRYGFVFICLVFICLVSISGAIVENRFLNGGEGGIRTHDTVSRMPVF